MTESSGRNNIWDIVALGRRPNLGGRGIDVKESNFFNEMRDQYDEEYYTLFKDSLEPAVTTQLCDEVEHLRKENAKLSDLLLDAYICGYNDGRQGMEPNPEPVLTELVEGEGLDPKKVLRRLSCKQQTEDPYGDCSCE